MFLYLLYYLITQFQPILLYSVEYC